MQEKAAFTLMCWSLIDAMRSGEAPRAQAALEALCQAYWSALCLRAPLRAHR